MVDIELNFVGPFSFLEGESCLFQSSMAQSAGVYLHTIKQDVDNTHLIHYIGETASFSKRHKEHLVNILGLNYGIFDPDKARQGICEILWRGLWRVKTADGPSFQVDAYRRLHNDILRYLSVLSVFFAELEGDDLLRRQVEGCIGWNLRNNHPDHKALYPDDNRIGAKNDTHNGNLRIAMPEIIRGPR